MKVAIMQPYFVPYIGYFQLINTVDKFVIYDDIEYTKKGWINRNRILANGKDSYLTLPIKKDSDFLDVKDRFLAGSWPKDKKKILNVIVNSYKKAPFYDDVFPVFEKLIYHEDLNLFNFILNSLTLILDYLNISTPLIKSSDIGNNSELKSEHRVIDICQKLEADIYLNAIGGIDLYKQPSFKKWNIELKFLKTSSFQYQQFKNDFIPWLSIVDVMMFNSIKDIKNFLDNGYEFVL